MRRFLPLLLLAACSDAQDPAADAPHVDTASAQKVDALFLQPSLTRHRENESLRSGIHGALPGNRFAPSLCA